MPAPAADAIHADAIAVLVDLIGRSGIARLGVCAARPAPVPATCLLPLPVNQGCCGRTDDAPPFHPAPPIERQGQLTSGASNAAIRITQAR